MSAATLDAPAAPTLEPITDDEVEAFSKALESTPAPPCGVFNDQPEHPATGRIMLAPCAHSWLSCRPCWVLILDNVAAHLVADCCLVRCAVCNVAVTAVSWSDL